jgi:hypothetical protein
LLASVSANNNVDDMTRPDYLQRADAGDVKKASIMLIAHRLKLIPHIFTNQTTLQKTLFDFPFPAQLQHKAI